MEKGAYDTFTPIRGKPYTNGEEKRKEKGKKETVVDIKRVWRAAGRKELVMKEKSRKLMSPSKSKGRKGNVIGKKREDEFTFGSVPQKY